MTDTRQIHRSRRYVGLERRSASPALWAVLATWVVFSALAYATLCPIADRPHMGAANEERFWAHFVFGACVSFAYPRHADRAVFGVTMMAFALEVAQMLVPGRDTVFADACVKGMGGVCGVLAAQTSYAVKRLLVPTQTTTSAFRQRSKVKR